MQDGNLELIITLVSIIGANLGAIFGAFGFLHREMRRGFEKVDQRFEKVDQRFEKVDQKFGLLEKKFDGKLDHLEERFDKEFAAVRADVGTLQVSLARIEGHLGLAALPPAAQLGTGDPPAQTA